MARAHASSTSPQPAGTRIFSGGRFRVAWTALALGLLICMWTTDAVAVCGCLEGAIQSDDRGPCLENAALRDHEGKPSSSKIVWRFNESGRCWSYVDGSWGVESGLTLTQIQPDHSPSCEVGSEECRNGYMINPSDGGESSWDGRITGNFVPIAPDRRLPLRLDANTSIVKATSIPGACSRPCVKYMSVLTVMDGAPEQPSFRPPMTHAYKPEFAASLHLDLLPQLPAPKSVPGWQQVHDLVRHTTISWSVAWYMSQVVPQDARVHYFPDSDSRRSKAYLYLMTDRPEEHKAKVATALVQEGIDLYGALRGGFRWPADAGIRNGRYLPIVFAATMLGSGEISAVLEAVRDERNSFSEWDHFYEGKPLVELEHLGASPILLYGRPGIWGNSEEAYWNCAAAGRGSSTGKVCSGKDLKDPYERQDGGSIPGSSYMSVVWGPYKYTALMHWLMPGLRPHWGNDRLLRYVDRLEEFGVRTRPDECAPIGRTSGYRSTWGPDPDAPGECIRGSGRWRSRAGYDINRQPGNRTHRFGQAMWNAYRACAQNCTCTGMRELCGEAAPEDAAATSTKPPLF